MDLAFPPFDGSTLCWIAFGAVASACLVALNAGMRHGAHVLTAIGGLGMSALLLWASPVLAQPPEDLRTFVAGVEAKARTSEDALRDWTAQIAARRPGYEKEAEDLARANSEQLRRGLNLVDDRSLAGAAQEFAGAPDQQAWQDGAAYVAVSLSMPPEALRQLAFDAQKAGASVVIRGLINGSFPQTLAAVKRAFDDKTAAGIAIDPQVFRTYDVKTVPTFIVARRPAEPCNGLDCVSPAPPHDRIAGNISLKEAMRRLAQDGSEAPDISASLLTKLGG